MPYYGDDLEGHIKYQIAQQEAAKTALRVAKRLAALNVEIIKAAAGLARTMRRVTESLSEVGRAVETRKADRISWRDQRDQRDQRDRRSILENLHPAVPVQRVRLFSHPRRRRSRRVRRRVALV